MNFDKFRQCGNCTEFPCSSSMKPWDVGCGSFVLKKGDVWVQKQPSEKSIIDALSKYKNEKGKFVPKLLSDEILTEYSILTFEDTGESAIYKDGVYKTSKKDVVLRSIIKEKLGNIFNRNNAGDSLEHIKLSTITKRNTINHDPFMINVQNGMYDVVNDKLCPHNQKYLSTIQLNVVYDKEAECTAVHKFLTEVVAPQDIPLLVQYAGYCCTPDISHQKALLLDGGMFNGKSTFIDLVSHMIGDKHVSEQSLQELNTNRFSRVQLKDKLVNMFPDLSKKKIYDNSVFKMLTTDEWISGEDKGISSHKFQNTIHQIYSANKVPDVEDPDELSYFRRWIMVTFPNSFEGKADKSLKRKLRTVSEISGFFNIAMIGLRYLLKYDMFCFEKTAEEIKYDYLIKSNPVYCFAGECLELSVHNTLKIDVFEEYKKWCGLNNLPEPHDTVFGKIMKDIGYVDGRGDKDNNGNRLRVWDSTSLAFCPSVRGVRVVSRDEYRARTLSKEAFDNVFNEYFRKCPGVRVISTYTLYEKYYSCIYIMDSGNMPGHPDTSESLNTNQYRETFEMLDTTNKLQESTRTSPDTSKSLNNKNSDKLDYLQRRAQYSNK